MRYLVTGGAGFIGSHLCEHLLQAGHAVSIIDDLSSGNAANVAHLQSHSCFTSVFASISDRLLVSELVSSVDIVIHLAASVGVELAVRFPVNTIEANILGCRTLLELSATGRKKVLIASSSEVYGKSTKLPFHEDDSLLFAPSASNRWSYACSKIAGEFLALAYYRERSTPVTIVRLFNTVGPRQSDRYGMVLARFVQQALRGEPLTVHGDGNQQRCFAYVGDVVAGIAALAEEPAAIGQIVNLGSNQEISINELARVVVEAAGSRSLITHIPYSEAYGDGFEDVRRRVPSLDKAARLVGYRPSVGIGEIISRVIDHVSK